MPVVQVHIKEGRSMTQRRELVRRITQDLVEVCGAAEERVHVIINEVPTDQWGRGGTLLSDISAAAAADKG